MQHIGGFGDLLYIARVTHLAAGYYFRTLYVMCIIKLGVVILHSSLFVYCHQRTVDIGFNVWGHRI
jgi:hypothetical protein